MILSIGARTDIVNHYGEWLMNRFRAGEVYTRNPLFPNKVTRYELSPEKIDALLFESKNYAPFLDRLSELESRYRLLCQFTVTCYGRDIEPNIPDLAERVRILLETEKIVGKRRLVWRYAPVLLTREYPVERHIETFERLCAALAGHVDRCIFAFVEMHVRLQSNLPGLIPLTEEDKQKLARAFGAIARKYGVPIQACGSHFDFEACGVPNAPCVTLDQIGKANGCAFRAVRHAGNRRNCKCIESRDVGWYDTCPNRCRYCYATKQPELVDMNRAEHDVNSPIFIGKLRPTDTVMEGSQVSFLRGNENQLSLFD